MLASSDQADEDVVPEALSVQVVVLKRPDFEYLGRAVLALPTPGSCATWSIGTASSRPLMESHQEFRRVESDWSSFGLLDCGVLECELFESLWVGVRDFGRGDDRGASVVVVDEFERCLGEVLVVEA